MKPVNENIVEILNQTFREHVFYYHIPTGYRGTMVINTETYLTTKLQRELIPYTEELRKDIVLNTRRQIKQLYDTTENDNI